MITYRAIGYWVVLTLIPAAILLRLLPAGSRARAFLARVILAALILIAALVGFSY
ncbi:hypothetical protein [Streptomyces sp. 8L]|uniref:hypothetical protein n=1 Tax=Streptomyces sp. 8L TaxID=2877242 RepID=UPI001CD6250F|nr:hypothetical protein [Streptomyces sp. 8L]MCA1218680.1 hypothetical protein [Streptomyces sp. 8L]